MEMKRYLGDGAYVEWDGYALVLTAENGIAVTERVVLEPDVYDALVRFVDELPAWRDRPSDVDEDM